MVLESFRGQKLAYMSWFTCNQMSYFMVHRQKISLLMSLTGPVTKANKLYGPTSPNYGPEEPDIEGFIDFEEFFTRIKSIFMPKSKSNLSRLNLNQQNKGHTNSQCTLQQSQILRWGHSSTCIPMCKGLYSSVVHCRVVDLNPTSDSKLIKFCAVSEWRSEGKSYADVKMSRCWMD